MNHDNCVTVVALAGVGSGFFCGWWWGRAYEVWLQIKELEEERR